MIIDDFLSKFGKVNPHHRAKTDSRGVETFEHVFWMKETDIRENPLPNHFWLGRRKIKVYYPGQPKMCWYCSSPEHQIHDCELKKNNISVFDTGNTLKRLDSKQTQQNNMRKTMIPDIMITERQNNFSTIVTDTDVGMPVTVPVSVFKENNISLFVFHLVNTYFPTENALKKKLYS